MKKDKEKKPRRLVAFVKKHKVLSAVLALVLVAALVVGGVSLKNTKNTGTSYSFVRTTTLVKGTLEDTVSATGTVASSATSQVTTNLQYTVKSVKVAVGDKVEKGDVLVTLDTEELEEQIAKEESNLEKTKSAAQTAYNNAKTSYDTAKEALEDYASTLSEAKSAYTAAKTPYNNAVKSLSSYQDAYDTALENYNSAGAKYVSALAAYNKAVSAYKKGNTTAAKLQSAANAYMKAVQNYYGKCSAGTYDISDGSTSAGTQEMGEASSDTAVKVTESASEICSDVVSTVKTLTGKTLSVPSGSNTLYKLSQKAQALQSAKTACNYASLESAYTTAKNAYDEAKNTYEQMENELSQAKSQLSQAKEELENASESDTLDDLKAQLSECSLTAEQDGTVTALSATVGSVCKDSVATIQNLDALTVAITIEEADINNVELGLTCHITSDASDETLEGTLTQIDPVSENGSFEATVTVNTATDSLYIGMNASVDIIVSASADVYQVPLDAVGEENGEKYVLRKTGGEGTEATFEKVTVTTGESNDYYIEIASDDLSEGDVIRSSADLTQGVDTVSTEESENKQSGGLFASLFGGNNNRGNEMPQGGGQMRRGDTSSSGSSEMPSPPSDMGGGPNG